MDWQSNSSLQTLEKESAVKEKSMQILVKARGDTFVL